MKIIPVLDLMNGVAVHARQGHRDHYRPLQSPLCGSAEPRTVLAGLLGLHPFETVYIADLDALMGKPPQTALMDRLRRAFPGIVFWIDQGWPDEGLYSIFPPNGKARRVIGSESLNGERLAALEQAKDTLILSLDFKEEGLLGPVQLLEQSENWPEEIILMTLARVGGGEGPDFARAERFLHDYPGHRYVAAGGVRNDNDLRRLQELGMAGVLIASALHSGAVDERTLRQFDWQEIGNR